MKKTIFLFSFFISLKILGQSDLSTSTGSHVSLTNDVIGRNIADIKLKKNIVGLHGALATILKFRGVTYEWKTKSYPQFHHRNGKEIGLLAQEVEEIEPLLVDTDHAGFKSIEYERISVLLIEAIKEQQQLINHLKRQQIVHETEINKLKTLLLNKKTKK